MSERIICGIFYCVIKGFTGRELPVERAALQNWKEQITAHIDLLDRLAAKRFGDNNLADEAVLYALEQFKADNWRRLEAYTGQAKFSTYLASISFRLFEDFARKRFGRVTMPEWIKKLGRTWQQLFRLLCLERLSMVEAIDNITTNHSVSDAEAEDAASTILSEVTNCGHRRGHTHSADEETLEQQAAGQASATDGETVLAETQKNILFQTIFGKLLGNPGNQEMAQEFSNVLDQPVILSSEEKLLLKLCFQDGLSVSDAGRMLDLNTNQAHGRMRRLLGKIKAELAQAGLSEELTTLLKE